MSDGPCMTVISSLQNPPMTPTSVPVTTCRYLINFLFEMEKEFKMYYEYETNFSIHNPTSWAKSCSLGPYNLLLRK